MSQVTMQPDRENGRVWVTLCPWVKALGPAAC